MIGNWQVRGSILEARYGELVVVKPLKENWNGYCECWFSQTFEGPLELNCEW